VIAFLRHLFMGRPLEQSCENCQFFIDHRHEDDDMGYCGQLVAAKGMEQAVKINPYGGFWTLSTSWCSKWQGGPPMWTKGEPS